MHTAVMYTAVKHSVVIYMPANYTRDVVTYTFDMFTRATYTEVITTAVK